MAAQTYEAFMSEIAARDPERYAVVVAKFPVLSSRQMRARGEREISISQMREPGYFWDLLYAAPFTSDDKYSKGT